MNILVISGPNLNLLGHREPETYGTITLDQIHNRLHKEAEQLNCSVVAFQSNHEGAILDLLHYHRATAAGAILNAGGLTHTSVSLHDAIKAMNFPVIEVHISNIHAREEWRKHSVISPATRAQVAGFGWLSYVVALHGLVRLLRDEQPGA